MSPLNPIHPSMLPRLDPRFVEYYNANLADVKGTHQVPLEEVRANPAAFARKWAVDPDAAVDPLIRDWDVPVQHSKATLPIATAAVTSFKVRTYSPDESKWGPGPYPAHLNFHGGGWVFGDLGSDAAICLRLKERLPIVLVDVDYRLCPEYEFGHNVEDAWTSLLWTRTNASTLDIDPSSISVGGISAGAHLACTVQHRARNAGIPLTLLIATVPPLADHHIYSSASDSPWPSFGEFSRVPLLDWERMAFFQKHCFEKTMQTAAVLPHWWISPLRAQNWSDLCDAFIATAECDMLRDEGEAYGQKLLEGGNKVTMRRYLKVPHSFMHMHAVLPQARQYEDDVVAALASAHGVKK